MARASTRRPVADPATTAAALVEQLRGLGSQTDREGMSRFGINVERAFGVSIPRIRKMAAGYRGDHDLAAALWSSGWHEARLLAVFVDDPGAVTTDQMDSWAAAFDSWDVTDQATTSLFDLTPYAWDKAREWSRAEGEYVKRGAFALMAGLAVHDREASDDAFVALLPLIERESRDERNFVKKAVNWALRNIGKRNAELNIEALASARRILDQAGSSRDPASRAARWVAKDALRELDSEKLRARLGSRSADAGTGGVGR